MIKSILATAVLSTLLAIPATTAFADDQYVSAELASFSASGFNGHITSPGMGVRIAAGYVFAPNAAVEIAHIRSGEGHYGKDNQTGKGIKYAMNSTTVALVGTYPLEQGFSLSGQLGVAFNNQTGDLANANCGDRCSSTGLMFGAGASYKINKEINVGVKYQNLGNFTSFNSAGLTEASMSSLSFGGSYNF